MITKMRPRYYCEHCGKSGGSKYHMRRHEEACTLNKWRKCRMCEYACGGNEDGHSIYKMIEALKKDIEAHMHMSSPTPINNLLEEAEHCPACTLAAIRQYAKLVGPENVPMFDWDYRKAKDEMWQECRTFDEDY